MASVLLFSSVVTGLWGVAAVAQANWLDANDLPVGGVDTWGVRMLILAFFQGFTALLILFARRLGAFLGIALAVFNILVNLAVVRHFPIGSLVSIAVNVVVIAVLQRSRLRLRTSASASALTRLRASAGRRVPPAGRRAGRHRASAAREHR